MIRTTIPFALAAIAVPAAAADVQVATQGPVVELSVTETVKAKPDIAEVGAGVTTDAPTAVAAMAANAKAMDAVIARIKSLGIAADDIQTTGINLGAQYDYDQARQRPIFRGYQASNRVSVTLRDVSRAGPVLDALVAAGATDLSGPSFSMDDDSAPRAQARKAAFDKARAQAAEYARWAGYTGVRVVSISEAVNPGRPMPMLEREAVQSMDAKSTPVEPGLVGTSVTVSVTFEMTR
ncbi:26 kDa periplasmic immunogenic protein precursor [Tsuneonella dongtanensis]|uniref:26 kDa periplasmic immunogenic protein n=1 Tax=Tsuneonella dongtanensis TaxID=692370 RepID=A0A1B2AG97_9SPHN|nr:SIMPL domain-containing protein [Tsuneonella dongtanensis]ANY21170.1 26 kDa periplasmic immunogenic protein precursor [Tsuneonella dongtanensis]